MQYYRHPKVSDNYPTLGVYNLDVWCGATEGNSDFLETGVKGDLPGVADPNEVISGQQVDL